MNLARRRSVRVFRASAARCHGLAGRIGHVGVVAGALLAASAVPALAGADPAANVHVTIGSPEVIGFAGNGSGTLTLKLKRGGSVIATKTFSTDGSGFFDVDLKPVRIGDKVVIQFQGTRTVTVPKVTLKANPTTDTVSGHIPEPGGDADVAISNAVGGFSLMGGVEETYTANGNGDFGGTHAGLAGADRLELRWFNPLGDSFTVELAVKAIQAQVGSTKAWLFGRPGTTVKAVLLAPNGTVRGTATVKLPGSFPIAQATFRKNGTPVKVKAGDRVRIGSTTGLTLRTPDLAVESASATATCFPNQDWVIGTVFGGGAFSYLDDGAADGSGNVTASWASPLTAGTKVKLMCENARGWTQDMVDTAP